MVEWKKIEAVLFASGRYLSEEELGKLSGLNPKDVKKALKELGLHYSEGDTSLKLFNEGNQWKLNVKEDYTDVIRNVVSEAELPTQIMATLAIIAYKNPILQSEVIDARGTGAYEHIKILEDKNFIVREKFGRTYKLKVAEKFFEYFDVEGEGNIRELFKDVKKPDPEKLGTLKIYDSEETENDDVFNTQISERMKKLDISAEDSKTNNEFLDKMDEKLVAVKARIDSAEAELTEFKRVEPSVEEPLNQPNNLNSKVLSSDIEKIVQDVYLQEKEESPEDYNEPEIQEDEPEVLDENLSTQEVLEKVNKDIDDIVKNNSEEDEEKKS